MHRNTLGSLSAASLVLVAQGLLIGNVNAEASQDVKEDVKVILENKGNQKQKEGLARFIDLFGNSIEQIANGAINPDAWKQLGSSLSPLGQYERRKKRKN